MVEIQRLEDEVHLGRYEYDDREVVVADFGPGRNVAVDVVDGTAIVVVGKQQYELEVDGDPRAFIRNGVLTIEVEQ